MIMDAIQHHSLKDEWRNHTDCLTLLLDGAKGPDGRKNKVDPERKNNVCDGVWRLTPCMVGVRLVIAIVGKWRMEVRSERG